MSRGRREGGRQAMSERGREVDSGRDRQGVLHLELIYLMVGPE